MRILIRTIALMFRFGFPLSYWSGRFIGRLAEDMPWLIVGLRGSININMGGQEEALKHSRWRKHIRRWPICSWLMYGRV